MAMENSGMSAGDILALTRNNNDGLFGGDVGGILAIIIVFILLFGGGGNGWFGNNSATQATLQTADLYSALVAQDVNANIRNGFTNNDNGQCAIEKSILNAQYSDQLAMNQGFNSVNANLNNGFMSVNNSINDLAHQMESMCCDIKTTLLQGRYEDAQNALIQAQNQIVNQQQSAYILGQLGRYVSNPPVPPLTFGTTIA